MDIIPLLQTFLLFRIVPIQLLMEWFPHLKLRTSIHRLPKLLSHRNSATCDKDSQLSVRPILARVTSGHCCPTASLRPRLILLTVSLSSFVIVSSPTWLWRVSPRGLFASHLLHTSLITATGTLHSSGWPNTPRPDVKDTGFTQQLHLTKGRGFIYFPPIHIFFKDPFCQTGFNQNRYYRMDEACFFS